MATLNAVQLIGNLGADPEMRYTPNGRAVAEFSLAVNTGYGDSERTDWVDCVCWEKQAEFASKYLEKGSQVLVEGSLQQDKWVDQNSGQNRSRLRVRARRVQGIGRRGDDTGASSNTEPELADMPF